MNFLTLSSFIFFVRQMGEKQMEMRKAFQEGRNLDVIKLKSQFSILHKRASKEKAILLTQMGKQWNYLIID